MSCHSSRVIRWCSGTIMADNVKAKQKVVSIESRILADGEITYVLVIPGTGTLVTVFPRRSQAVITKRKLSMKYGR